MIPAFAHLGYWNPHGDAILGNGAAGYVEATFLQFMGEGVIGQRLALVLIVDHLL